MVKNKNKTDIPRFLWVYVSALNGVCLPHGNLPSGRLKTHPTPAGSWHARHRLCPSHSGHTVLLRWPGWILCPLCCFLLFLSLFGLTETPPHPHPTPQQTLSSAWLCLLLARRPGELAALPRQASDLCSRSSCTHPIPCLGLPLASKCPSCPLPACLPFQNDLSPF